VKQVKGIGDIAGHEAVARIRATGLTRFVRMGAPVKPAYDGEYEALLRCK
jgi:hypothetical protein